ncbi:hypothetical protein J0A67_04765 [Algoriphagus aestuariicola]|uniref:DUF5675 domain-containing protein n=1 Tax=Algoriphagus aestuariicola TaxID=1852016 RepID=A0ABS3BPA7_9BACT|nr:DUF5675 family protein [Algoriphagus aestuariicola]MBN7800160.1 hypothetical protein [Algoriphagus aestuariicola]
MNFLLTREYWPGGTNGSLVHEGNILCATVELPSACFKPPLSCLPEGKYELRVTSSSQEPVIGIFRLPFPVVGEQEAKAELGARQLHRNIVLVSEITGEGRGVPSRETAQNLAFLIGQASEKGERAYLEIRSYPEAALNLTYHQIRWMD